MENATKALLMAAGVLIGMLIIGLGVTLYYSLNNYVEQHQANMEEHELNKFNIQFLQYVSDGVNDVKITVQDIVTVAHLASENNDKYNLTNGNNGANYYVEVNAKFKGTTQINNLERNVNSKAANWLTNYQSDYEYKCTVKISNKTGRVYEINFK